MLKHIATVLTQGYWDRRALRSQRAHYYEYFARLMQATDGRMTVLKFFQNEAHRYAGKARGRMSELFVERIGLYGADLVKIWQGTFPDSDLLVIAAAQDSGLDATIQSLNTLARMTRMAHKAMQDFMSVVLVGLVAVCVALAMLFIFPNLALSQYNTIFSNLPLERWPDKAQTLLALASFSTQYAWLLVILIVLAITLFYWSLPNWTGPLRKKVDAYLPYRLYRDYHGAMFLSLLAVLSAGRGRGGQTMRTSLSSLETHATPWLSWHIQAIINNVDTTSERDGLSLAVFDTGLLSQDNVFLMQDIGDGLGISQALSTTSDYVSDSVIQSVSKNAAKLRWYLLFLGIAVTAYVFYITNTAGSQLIEATKMSYQSKQ